MMASINISIQYDIMFDVKCGWGLCVFDWTFTCFGQSVEIVL